MHTVQIRLPNNACEGPMQQMRGWIDAHHCEPVQFSHHDLGRQTAVVVVEFNAASDANSFAKKFAGTR